MNLDANVQKILLTLLKKWKLIVIFAIIGCVLAYFYTANFTSATYSSSVEFLAYAEDTDQELSDSSSSSSFTQQSSSNTSKMNYAMKMLDTYIELFKTTEFNQDVADAINENLNLSVSASTIKNSATIEEVSSTAMFKITIVTNDAQLSYEIAKQLEESIPEAMSKTNSGLVKAEVIDQAIKATEQQSKGFTKKCLIGTAAGIVLAAVYIILRDLLDVRIKSSEELIERYDIPVLGVIPKFEIKTTSKTNKTKKGAEK